MMSTQHYDLKYMLNLYPAPRDNLFWTDASCQAKTSVGSRQKG